MTALYPYFGITRQGAYAAWRREEEHATVLAMVAELVHAIRADHPRMGLRKIYTMLAPLPIGRDAFERSMAAYGLSIHRVSRPWVTTQAQRLVRFPNLLAGLVINDMHQAWATDITYFLIDTRFVYLVFLLDVYTRVILGAVASRTMRAEANIEALEQALVIGGAARARYQTIHHSDRGGQYIDTEYSAILRAHRLRPSMCTHAYENAYAERVNGIIKNEYLYPRNIRTFDALPDALAEAVHAYNTSRPHWSLPRAQAPAVFANSLRTMAEEDRPLLHLYDSRCDESSSPAPRGRT